MLVGMTGKKRSGKDTAASMITTEWNFERVAFAGPLKGMIKYLLMCAGMSDAEAEARINGTEAEKEEPLDILQGKSARYAMQTLGTEWRDYLGKDLWSDIIKAKVESTPNVVISDLRFLHEAAFIRAYGGHVVRVIRPGTNTGDTHPSEVEMEKIVPDFTIYNFGTLEQFDAAVFRTMRTILGDREIT